MTEAALGLAALGLLAAGGCLAALRAVTSVARAAQARAGDALAAIPQVPQVELSEQQMRDLRTLWPRVVCSLCGTCHGGSTCPRVREIRYQANGQPERMLFWPEGRWSPPVDAIWAHHVFGGPRMPEAEEEKR